MPSRNPLSTTRQSQVEWAYPRTPQASSLLHGLCGTFNPKSLDNPTYVARPVYSRRRSLGSACSARDTRRRLREKILPLFNTISEAILQQILQRPQSTKTAHNPPRRGAILQAPAALAPQRFVRNTTHQDHHHHHHWALDTPPAHRYLQWRETFVPACHAMPRRTLLSCP